MNVLFFARLRDAIGGPSLTLPDDVRPHSVGELRAWLVAQENLELATALDDPNVFCAVNQRVVDEQHALSEGDEIAFFPPVTGG